MSDEYSLSCVFVMETSTDNQNNSFSRNYLHKFIETISLIPWETRVMHNKKLPVGFNALLTVLLHEFNSIKWSKQILQFIQQYNIMKYTYYVDIYAFYQSNEHFANYSAWKINFICRRLICAHFLQRYFHLFVGTFIFWLLIHLN